MGSLSAPIVTPPERKFLYSLQCVVTVTSRGQVRRRFTIDCVYHIALDELVATVNALPYPDAQDNLKIMIEGKRLRDISDLPLDLAI